MRRFLEINLKLAVALTAILFMVADMPVQAVPTPEQTGQLAGSGLLAQNTEKPLSQRLTPEEVKKVQPREAAPSPQMERMEKSVRPDMPQRAGTKKIGGQTIRAKESPREE